MPPVTHWNPLPNGSWFCVSPWKNTPKLFGTGDAVSARLPAAMLALPDAELTPEDREHVTAFFYRHAHRFRIHNIERPEPAAIDGDQAVDTLDDLRRLERLAFSRSAT